MLTLTLRALRRDRLIEREAYATVPLRVEYGLTALGRSLTGPLGGLAALARESQAAIEAARERDRARGEGA